MITARQRRERLQAGLKNEDKPLDLILEVDDKMKEKVARELDRVGKTIEVFKYVPYVAAMVSANDARAIADTVYGQGDFYKRLLNASLRSVRSMEIISTVSIPPLPHVRNSYRNDQDRLWNLENIGAYEALKHATGKGILVGVVDTGVDYDHPELRDRFGREKGARFFGGSDPMDQDGHGTHVAGTVAGKNVGVARDCTLLAIGVLDSSGIGSEVSVMQGIEYALDKGCEVINMSLGSSVATNAFEELCEYAHADGMLLVAAAGNDGGRVPNYPASFGKSVVSVAAVDKNNKHANFSTIYETNDISAPGVGIYSTFPGGRYREFDGTSMATPHVTGSVALALEAGATSIDSLLESTAERLGNDWDKYGAGLVRVDKLVGAAMNSRKPSLLERVISW